MQSSQASTIGAKMNPTRCVPKCWSANRNANMTQVMGMTASACKSDQSSEPPNRFKSELGG
jgi:hypothetical protein